jgi:hypothetical protein
MGRNLYPKAPDMRLATTQDLTDGEIFAIIENGVRLTGMPAWGDGTPESTRASWELVHLVRRFPTITESEIVGMAALNPRPRAVWEEEREIEAFLRGEDRKAPPKAHH